MIQFRFYRPGIRSKKGGEQKGNFLIFVHHQNGLFMALAGYSGTALIKKLGIKDDMKVLLIGAPKDYLQWLEKDISAQLVTGSSVPDFIHLFSRTRAECFRELIRIKKWRSLNPSITIWVSWYKKSAGIPTDLTEQDIRNFALQHDLVDVKVCAVTNQWSGLKLVVPLSKR